MKIRSKRIWLALAALLALGALAGIWWVVATRAPEQIITLSNGQRYRFAGASWGTNHSQPRLLAHLVDHLPNRWGNYVRAKLGPRTGLAGPIRTQPALLIWLEPVGTNATIPAGRALEIEARLADANGVQGGVQGIQVLVAPGPPGWTFLQFPIVPRRSRRLECQIQELSFTGQPVAVPDHWLFKFRNPLSGHFPQWTPEVLPAAKAAGDLQVQLAGFSTNDGYTEFSLVFNSPRGTHESWTVEDTELSDATGNRLTDASGMEYGKGPYRIQGTLWPEESALRLKVGLKRASGFPQSDFTTFTNLPVFPLASGSTNGTSLTNLVGGSPIILRNYETSLFWRGPAPGPYWVSVDVPGLASGTAVDIENVTTDTGENIAGNASGWSQLWRNYRSMPANAKFLNVTVAVQKKRYVEFLVKPPK